MPECPACGAPHEAGVSTCSACGVDIAGATASFEPIAPPQAEMSQPVPQGDVPVLVVRKGPDVGERFYIDRPRLGIGRDPEADIFLNDITVSRAHATVELAGGIVSIRDAGSLNGTYVNGVCVDSATLSSGDIVQVGTFQMLFADSSEA